MATDAQPNTAATEPAEQPLEQGQRPLTWQEKLEKKLPLNEADETRYDADFNFHRNERDRKERAEHEARKAGANNTNK